MVNNEQHLRYAQVRVLAMNNEQIAAAKSNTPGSQATFSLASVGGSNITTSQLAPQIPRSLSQITNSTGTAAGFTSELKTQNPQLKTDNSKLETRCALCGLPVSNRLSGALSHGVTGTFDGQELAFCCYGCRHIYEIVAPELSRGVSLRQAMGQCGLDLNTPCCRGVIHGDPAEAAANTLSRLMLNAFLAMMVMVLSLALYSDFFFADWGASGQSVRSILQAITMLFATPAVLLLALPILEDAIFSFQVYRRLNKILAALRRSLVERGISRP